MKQHPSFQSDFEKILAQLPEEEQAEARVVWEASTSLDDHLQPNEARIAAMWKDLAPQATSTPDRPPARIHRMRRVFAWPVAATALIAAIGLFLWMRPAVYEVPAGEQLTVTLPDGSQVDLNSGSTLRVYRQYSQARRVSLDGEAFFSVVEDDIPFQVETFNAQVEVLGTTFNVLSWPTGSQPATAVTLETGKVRFASLHSDGPAVEMTPGQTRVLHAADPSEIRADDPFAPQAYAWRQGDFVIISQALQVVIEDIERRYNVEIDPLSAVLQKRQVSISLRGPVAADEVIEAICYGLGLTYRPTLRGYEIHAAQDV